MTNINLNEFATRLNQAVNIIKSDESKINNIELISHVLKINKYDLLEVLSNQNVASLNQPVLYVEQLVKFGEPIGKSLDRASQKFDACVIQMTESYFTRLNKTGIVN